MEANDLMELDDEDGAVQTESRAARRDNDIDPTRGIVLYMLTVAAYLAEYGKKPTFADLNRLFPPSAAGSLKSETWSRLSRGDGLPRHAATPQALLMRKLMEVYPSAAASYYWPIWRLSSSRELTLPEVHGLMLQLPVGFRHMLFGSYPNGRFQRYQTDPRDEVGFMARENSLGGVSALIALMREAELKQDPLTHAEAYHTMLPHLTVLDQAFGSSTLGQKFADFLKKRFETMEFIVPGAYESVPGTDAEFVPLRFRLPHRLDHETVLRKHAEWRGLPADVFEEVLKARREAHLPGDGPVEPDQED